jgi:GNAT superfamily N-acetyltransferase
MLIRFGQDTDIEQIARNNVQLARISEDRHIQFDQVFKGVKRVIEDRHKGFYLVAEEKNIIIGQILVTFEWSDWKAVNMWWLQSIYVQEKWRRHGILKKLLNFVHDLATRENVTIFHLYVHNNNKKAIKIYERMGMKKEPYTMYGHTIEI